jgi:ribose transport system permease protein
MPESTTRKASVASGGRALARVQRRVDVAALLTRALVSSGFIPVWIATGALFIVAAIIAPETLQSNSWSVVLPLASFLAIAALGEMLVIMTGGFDLSIPGVMVLAANVVVGVAGGSDDKIAVAIVVCLGWSALIGLVNGLLVGVLRLNPLIVTLATGAMVLGIAISYAGGLANESAVPRALSQWATKLVFGVSWIFWVGVMLTVAIALFLRVTVVGRRFQAVGANPRAAWIGGAHVRTYIASAYLFAGVLYGTAGILLAAFIRSPSLDLGGPYLLGPIAAVVIAGASLSGGLASVTSTWVAAFALTLLSQMLRVLGLSTALQYVVFGAAIVLGMVISGDRIVAVLGGLLQRPSMRGRLATGEECLTVGEEGRDAFDDGNMESLRGTTTGTNPPGSAQSGERIG